MKSVAVVSGKGGTGKTTLTAVFARIAARQHRLALADADVEASNLPLALRVRDVSCQEFAGLAKTLISARQCTGCGSCAAACRFGAILQHRDGLYRVDPSVCEGCGLCVMVCPAAAITRVASSAGEACSGVSDIGPLAFGRLGPGQDLSGKLVTEVRRLALEAGSRHRADLMLIDGPPGTGCPLIAAVASTDLVVAVTEPTRSGAHDLERLVQVADRLQLPVRVVLNKADLSDEGAEHVRRLCDQRGLPLLAEVPFDPAFGLARQSRETNWHSAVAETSAAQRAAADAWRALVRELGLAD